MFVTDPRVDAAMNAAIHHLEVNDIPVTPQNQYQLLQSWRETLLLFEGCTELAAPVETLFLAMSRVLAHIPTGTLV